MSARAANGELLCEWGGTKHLTGRVGCDNPASCVISGDSKRPRVTCSRHAQSRPNALWLSPRYYPACALGEALRAAYVAQMEDHVDALQMELNEAHNAHQRARFALSRLRSDGDA